MNGLLTLVIAIVRAWVGAYTRGLPADLRAERREEIDCDLWEHHRLAEIERITPTGAAGQILFRFILGIPEDIFWRVEAGASVAKGRTSVNDSLLMRVMFGAMMLVLLVWSAMGIGIALAGDFDSSPSHVA